MLCKECGHAIFGEARQKVKDGVCPNCLEVQKQKNKIAADLLTSFGGKGKRGFVQWLKKGKFFEGLENDADVHSYNDRCDVIEALVGKENFERLLEAFAAIIITMAEGRIHSE